jgi:hypothetical protein
MKTPDRKAKGFPWACLLLPGVTADQESGRCVTDYGASNPGHALIAWP